MNEIINSPSLRGSAATEESPRPFPFTAFRVRVTKEGCHSEGEKRPQNIAQGKLHKGSAKGEGEFFALPTPFQRRRIIKNFTIDYNKKSELQILKLAPEYPLVSF